MSETLLCVFDPRGEEAWNHHERGQKRRRQIIIDKDPKRTLKDAGLASNTEEVEVRCAQFNFIS